MRTTVTLDADTERLLRRAMRERNLSFKAALNDAIRRGLRPVAERRFHVSGRAMPLRGEAMPLRLKAPYALADPLVKTTLRESPGLRARRMEIRAPRRDFPEEFLRAFERACELQRLPRGWNSHGAEPVSETAFRQAIEFLTGYVVRGVAAPALVPTVRGGLQLEWHRRGVDIEVEVGPDGSVSWCAEDRQSGEEVEEGLAGHEATVRTWLRRASD